MKTNLLVLLLVCMLGSITAFAQTFPVQGINYQGVAKDQSGKLLTSTPLSLRLSFVSKDDSGEFTTHYAEVHNLTTDNLGLFQLVIGNGKDPNGALVDIPWSDETVFLQTEMALGLSTTFELINRTELMAVPYAYFAATADQLISNNTIDLPTAKNQSLYWTTAGNSGTNPAVHFIGTTDNQPLIFKTNNVVSMTLTTDGRLQLANRTPAGPDNDKSSYPMVVDGKYNTQGIWIQINGSRSSANNFLTFEDANGVQGRVEGQTTSELESSTGYIYQSAIFTLNGVALGLNIAALVVDIADKWDKFWTWQVAGPAIAKMVTYTLQAAGLLDASIKWSIRIHNTVGVAYNSGNGDYAEWLKRKPKERDLQFGEIVGVDGGLISLNTQNCKQLLVVSKDPILLGKNPLDDKRQDYEKVAFMGQVLVKVVGVVNIGDYILPSGNNDGCGVAISPNNMKAGDYDKIVGVAWEAAKEGIVNYINVAVGINTNDLASKVDNLNQRVDNIMNYLEGKGNLNFADLQSKAMANAQENASKISTQFGKTIPDEEFDHILDQNQVVIRQVFALSKQKMSKQGYDPALMKHLDSFFSDPIGSLKKLRRDPNYMTYWSSIDNQIESLKK